MKLWISDKYFKRIQNKEKNIDWRDAHITFINEDTKEEMKIDVEAVVLADKKDDKSFILNSVDAEDFKFFDDDKLMGFALKRNESNDTQKTN